MKYNFDEIIDRENSNCVKYDLREEVFHNKDIIPMWVADMDFKTPDFILQSIQKHCEHQCFGYSIIPKDFYSSIIYWQEKIHNWRIEPEWLGYVQGIVPSLSFAVQIFSNPDDEIIIQTPVYHQFIYAVEKNNRKLIINQLKEIDGKFEMYFEYLQQKITPKTKIFLLCNPHNPGGRVWSENTLKKLAEICYKNNILVVSDEIHADMTFSQFKHIPFASVSELAKNNSITLTAPTKTFNMPAFQTAEFIIPNQEIRNKFIAFLDKNEIMHGNILGQIASISAYSFGNDYRLQMLNYLQNNINFAVDYFKRNIPQILPMLPEASFLIWLNCEKLNISPENLCNFMVEKANVGLNDGRMFGKGGENHLRMNIACPKSMLIRALDNIRFAVEKL
ncbi:MAG: PatB family C-S lyase [Bacteroidales bacterium]|jgi:cystathionine beta-lyase|nr:PatB family C-S lyase [Bacteroidales bacterium]